MWFIIPVKEFHPGRAQLNGQRFRQLVANSREPLGLLAWQGDDAVGWVAAGPRSRFARAVKTPTLRAVDFTEHDSVWLLPCLLVRRDRRGQGIAGRLISSAVGLAAKSGAIAMEGFPHSGSARHSHDAQVGNQRLFEDAGFRSVHHPSPSRVIMRRDFGRFHE
jgi:GNAT superfamily N-acetyltransferase